ncbi:MAG: molybdopterin-dependent oxidoreductase [Candidatus Methylomirabilis sp.]|nr:molybdopterin-dependent oxidoreductase [Candidatus Methylomirabilis sp.]
MVTGDQTNDFELFDVENARLVVVWGMNWITTKMPDSHWMTEARLKGVKTVAITVEYSATASKCDEVVVIRPGTDPAFALGLAQVLMAEQRYNADFVKRFTDLPTLVRMDTLERLQAKDLFLNYQEKSWQNWTQVVPKGKMPPPTPQQNGVQVPEHLVSELADSVMWDLRANRPVAVGHDDLGAHFAKLGIDPALSGSFNVTLTDGMTVAVRPVFDLTQEYLNANMTPEQCSRLTWAPEEAIRALAREIADSGGKTLIACGMGPNQFWNNDNKDRAIFLVLALTGSLGRHGGNIGSFAGTYKNTLFSGIGRWTIEDPFRPQLDPAGPVATRSYLRPESMHYWANGERIMKAGNKRLRRAPMCPPPPRVSGRSIPTPAWAIRRVFTMWSSTRCRVPS